MTWGARECPEMSYESRSEFPVEAARLPERECEIDRVSETRLRLLLQREKGDCSARLAFAPSLRAVAALELIQRLVCASECSPAVCPSRARRVALQQTRIHGHDRLLGLTLAHALDTKHAAPTKTGARSARSIPARHGGPASAGERRSLGRLPDARFISIRQADDAQAHPVHLWRRLRALLPPPPPLGTLTIRARREGAPRLRIQEPVRCVKEDRFPRPRSPQAARPGEHLARRYRRLRSRQL